MQLNDIQAIRRRYDHVYISPHFDDVAASCGGRLLKQKQNSESILVVTVFSAQGRQYPDANNSVLKASLDYEQRRLEDHKAMQQLGVDYLWLEYPEVLFRRQPPWRRYWPIFPTTIANQRLCNQVSTSLNEISGRTQCGNMILPLGIGQHVDHQIVFRAGLKRQYQQTYPSSVSFYEELPYALFPFLMIYRLKRAGIWHAMKMPANKPRMSNQNLTTNTLARLLGSLPTLGLTRKFLQPSLFVLLIGLDFIARFVIQPRKLAFGKRPVIAAVEDISSQIDQKLDLISAYASQLTSPLLSRRNIKMGLAAYGRTLGLPEGSFGERYWQIM